MGNFGPWLLFLEGRLWRCECLVRDVETVYFFFSIIAGLKVEESEEDTYMPFETYI